MMNLERLSFAGLILTGALACGVREHPHGSASGLRPSDDSLTVDLGGTTAPRDRVVAFILLGHSNMAGRAQAPEELHPFFFTQIDPRAWMFHADAGFRPAREPFTAGDSLSVEEPYTAGPGTALVKQAAGRAPGHHFVTIGYGRGSAYCAQFLPGAIFHDSAIAGVRAARGQVTFGGVVIMLGITERHGTPADITGYPDCINRLMTMFRDESGVPGLPLLLTDYEMESTGRLAPTREGFPVSIIPQIRNVPNVVERAAIVPTDRLGMADGHHFDLAGQLEWTRRLLDIMQGNGWFPWGADP